MSETMSAIAEYLLQRTADADGIYAELVNLPDALLEAIVEDPALAGTIWATVADAILQERRVAADAFRAKLALDEEKEYSPPKPRF